MTPELERGARFAELLIRALADPETRDLDEAMLAAETAMGMDRAEQAERAEGLQPALAVIDRGLLDLQRSVALSLVELEPEAPVVRELLGMYSPVYSADVGLLDLAGTGGGRMGAVGDFAPEGNTSTQPNPSKAKASKATRSKTKKGRGKRARVRRVPRKWMDIAHQKGA